MAGLERRGYVRHLFIVVLLSVMGCSRTAARAGDVVDMTAEELVRRVATVDKARFLELRGQIAAKGPVMGSVLDEALMTGTDPLILTRLWTLRRQIRERRMERSELLENQLAGAYPYGTNSGHGPVLLVITPEEYAWLRRCSRSIGWPQVDFAKQRLLSFCGPSTPDEDMQIRSVKLVNRWEDGLLEVCVEERWVPPVLRVGVSCCNFSLALPRYKSMPNLRVVRDVLRQEKEAVTQKSSATQWQFKQVLLSARRGMSFKPDRWPKGLSTELFDKWVAGRNTLPLRRLAARFHRAPSKKWKARLLKLLDLNDPLINFHLARSAICKGKDRVSDHLKFLASHVEGKGGVNKLYLAHAIIDAVCSLPPREAERSLFDGHLWADVGLPWLTHHYQFYVGDQVSAVLKDRLDELALDLLKSLKHYGDRERVVVEALAASGQKRHMDVVMRIVRQKEAKEASRHAERAATNRIPYGWIPNVDGNLPDWWRDNKHTRAFKAPVWLPKE